MRISIKIQLVDNYPFVNEENRVKKKTYIRK